MRRSSALRRLVGIAAVAAGLVTFPTPPASAQSCPTLPSLPGLPRQAVLDIWAPSSSQAPIYFVAPDPVFTYKLFAPVHATLLPPGTRGPDGTPIADIRIMLFGRADDRVKAASFTPTPLGQALPPAVLLSAESTPHLTTSIFDDASGNHWYNSDTLFCSGHTLTANGDIFVAGGTELYSIASPDRTTTVDVLYGLEYATRYSSFTTSGGGQWTKIDASFSPGQSNLPRRWYSAVTRLPDSRMLVTSGLDFVTLNSSDASGHHHLADGTPNRSVEVYDPSTGWSVISTHAETPLEVWNPDYTHVFPIPRPEAGNALLMFGGAGVPVYLLPDAAPGSRWIPQTAMVRPGAVAADGRNHGTSSALLPLRVLDGEWGYGNGSVVQAGGGRGSDDEHHIDVYEFCAKQWAPSSLEMGVNRRHPATVLLPDGKVLVLNGHDDSQPATAQPDGVRHAQYLDLRPPAPSFTVGMSAGGPAGEARGYHNVALLLPDGRVFVAGGRSRSEIAPPDAEDEKPTFRYLYPPYMLQPRPAITAAPPTIGYGASFNVSFSGGSISEAVLIGLGSMTHAFDTNQRHVQLPLVAPTSTSATIIGPPNRQTAPPGYYMLFVLNQANVPSIARIVRLE